MRNKYKPHRLQRGFTLLEVLVAFLIATFSLVTIFEIFNGSLSRLVTTNHRQHALELASSLINEQRAIRPKTATTISSSAGKFSWVITRSTYSDQGIVATSEWRPLQITVEVRWDALGGEQKISLTSVIMVRS